MKGLGRIGGRAVRAVRDFVDAVAGVPPRTLWVWSDRRSYFALIAAAIFIVLRLSSPLQYYKAAARLRKPPSTPGEERQKRRDFHAQDTERYFLIVLCFVLGVWAGLALSGADAFDALTGRVSEPVASWTSLLVHFAILVLAVECFTWSAYYLFWRNIAEPNYTLYHPAEYFVSFPVVIIVQVVALSVLEGAPPQAIVAGLTGGGEAQSWYLQLLGFFYLAIAIGNLRGMTPTPKFKSTSVVNIVGAGDVVADRLLPALIDDESLLFRRHVEVLTTDAASSRLEEIRRRGVTVRAFDDVAEARRTGEITKRLLASDAPAIIATPTDSHLAYMLELARAKRRFAVEKPLVRSAEDVDLLIAHRRTIEPYAFALSYYALEKALPLTYLLQPNPAHRPYLSVRDARDADAEIGFEALAEIRPALGPLKSLTISVMEDHGRSPRAGAARAGWTAAPDMFVFETAIHPLLLAHKVLVGAGSNGLPGLGGPIWTAGRGAQAPATHAISAMGLSVRVAGADGDGDGDGAVVRLAAAKHLDTTSRTARIVWKNASAVVDFDAKSMRLEPSSGRELVVRVKDAFQRNYAIQSDLVVRYFAEGWRDVRTDDFSDQITVLSWLHDQQRPRETASAAPLDYGETEGDGLIDRLAPPDPTTAS